MAEHPNITWEIIINNLDKFNKFKIWLHISANPNITFQFVCANPDYPWDWCGLSKNPNIDSNIVSSNPNLPWHYPSLSSNPNITWKIVISNLHKDLDFCSLSYNKMCYDPYFQSSHYRKMKLKEFWENSKEEFIARTWHPDRVNRGWCLDEDERKERMCFYGC